MAKVWGVRWRLYITFSRATSAIEKNHGQWPNNCSIWCPCSCFSCYGTWCKYNIHCILWTQLVGIWFTPLRIRICQPWPLGNLLSQPERTGRCWLCQIFRRLSMDFSRRVFYHSQVFVTGWGTTLTSDIKLNNWVLTTMVDLFICPQLFSLQLKSCTQLDLYWPWHHLLAYSPLTCVQWPIDNPSRWDSWPWQCL